MTTQSQTSATQHSAHYLSTLGSALSWGYHRLTAPPPAPAHHAAPKRRASPFQPPPLSPLHLTGYSSSTTTRLLSPTLAEEIRALLPARLQLHETWTLAYSLEQHGVSLGTLFESLRGGKQSACVLVVKDSAGGIFGAFVNEPFKPSGRYYGTGECFLWKAAILPPLSPRPQPRSDSPLPDRGASATPDRADRIRFKAFPYSGVNDYMILCDSTFLSVGGGDGKFGLWLDDSFEKGVSGTCLTFGNEPLSEEPGGKFDILGVELWRVDA